MDHHQEGRPSRWKDGLDRSFVHFQPITCRERKGSKRLAGGALGPLALGVGLLSPGAPRAVQTERRLAWRTRSAYQRTNPGHC